VVKAKDIYANGVVVLEDEASSIRRLLNFRELKDERKESVLNSLVYHIANRLEAEKDIDTELTWIFSAEEGATIKSELIDYLRDLDARWIDNKTRKKVMQKLLNIVMPGEDDMEDPEEYSLSVTPAEVIDDV